MRCPIRDFRSSSLEPDSTYTCQGCKFPPEGARNAALRTRVKTSTGTLLSRKPRTDRRERTASYTSTVSQCYDGPLARRDEPRRRVGVRPIRADLRAGDTAIGYADS